MLVITLLLLLLLLLLLFLLLLLDRSPKLSTVAKLLDTQYRMNADIGDWASIAMYDGQLRAHLSVAGHTLRELLPASDPEDELYPGPVLLVVDTAGCDMDEDTPSDGGSKRNQVWSACSSSPVPP